MIAEVDLSHVHQGQVSLLNQAEVMSTIEHCASVSLGLKYISAIESFFSVKDVLSKARCVRAIRLVDESTYRQPAQKVMPVALHDILFDIKKESTWSTMKEFQLDCRLLLPIDAYHATESPWLVQLGADIRHLSVQGHADTFDLFLDQVASLKGLVSVKFCCAEPYDGLTEVLEVSQSPFSRLGKLRELELEHVTSKIPLSYFANPKLRKLKVHYRRKHVPQTRRPTTCKV